MGGSAHRSSHVLSYSPRRLSATIFARQVLSMLIDEGPLDYVNVRATSGDTPLHRAAYWGRFSSVQMLLSRGANRLCLNDDGLGITAADMLSLIDIRADLSQPPNAVFASPPLTGDRRKRSSVIGV
ncbi:hypothetical protein T492DRAFT_918616 [Pavlovales sp. CCMP2436]|nr:hypothetical protein T492DRAFT_918616 [Pavlovales sp. CCMP2436]